MNSVTEEDANAALRKEALKAWTEKASMQAMQAQGYTDVRNIPKSTFYMFFLVHIGVFGYGWFTIFYGNQTPTIWFMSGGFAVFLYLCIYFAIFGRDKMKWLLINSLLGIGQVYAWLEIMGSWFIRSDGQYKTFESMPYFYHIVPGVYFVLYTFLLRNALIDLVGARLNPAQTKIVNAAFVVGSLALAAFGFLL